MTFLNRFRKEVKCKKRKIAASQKSPMNFAEYMKRNLALAKAM